MNKPHDDPPTSEERYHAAWERWGTSNDPDLEYAEVGSIIGSLHDMIASLDAELARLTETVNRQETDLSHMWDWIRDAGEHTPDPDTVAVPRSLMAVLDDIRCACRTTDADMWGRFAREYDAWKARQG